jgi:hypothetical protein
MNKKLNYSVPDGYFENLKTRLSQIPAQESRPSRITRLTPYLALAACFAFVVLVGNAVLNRTAVPAASDEEIIEYLIDSDITLAQVVDYLTLNE